MVTVMDDYSRFILSWRLQVDMTSPSLIEVVQDAVDLTGMTDVQVEERTRLLSDNGLGYISRAASVHHQLRQNTFDGFRHNHADIYLKKCWLVAHGGSISPYADPVF